MEFFIGAAVTFAILFFVANNAQKRIARMGRVAPIRYSQSYIFNLISPIIPSDINVKQLVSQATKFDESRHMRVFLDFDKAYWIKNNRLYSADFIDGVIVYETEKEVDTMVVNKVELDKLTFIVEKLTEGLSNDSGSSGN